MAAQLTPTQILKKEQVIIGFLLVVALGINLFATLNAGEKWSLIFTELHVALAIAAVLYVGIGMFRLTFRFFTGTVKSYNDYNKPEDF